MQQVIQSLKLEVLNLIRRFGYAIHKLPPRPKKTSRVVSIMLGGKSIKIHSGNPLCFQYRNNPNYNNSIGILAALVQSRFPKAWVVDVGANVGDTLAIIKGQSSLPVICVEGDAICYDLLQQNARLFDNVHPFRTFLSDQPSTMQIATQKDGWNMTLTQANPGHSGRPLQFETLDRLVQKLNPPAAVKLMKVDTEGYDLRILRGASDILARDQPVITFELNRENLEPLGDSVGDFFDYLVNLGYHHFILHDAGGRPICALGQHEKSVFLDLYQYSNLGQPIYYFDISVFHENDKDLFEKFLTAERTKRN
jgi:FkbM family methyltransferase